LLDPGRQLVLLKMTTQQGDDGGLRLTSRQDVRPIDTLPAKLAATTVTLPLAAATVAG
jgi:hypothetical protein